MYKQYYEIEKTFLSPFAQRSDKTKGRDIIVDECSVRTPYQRDRDRIVHSKAFRRLKHKTQVFLSPEGDHYRTRLTHTLEVSQVARTIARALRLNEDLCEAISLGHDLGHTPFGHAGERALREITGHFEHNEQSLRIVQVLENEGKGLNLNYEVYDGILNHTHSSNPKTLEAKVVSYSDRIAYINHDIDDAIRAGIITVNDLPKDCCEVLGKTIGARMSIQINDVIKNSKNINEIKMSKEIDEASNKLRNFMFKNVYTNNIAKVEEIKVNGIVELLFEYFNKHVNKLPPMFIKLMDTYNKNQVITDYIASMSDRYAVSLFNEIYVPRSWQLNKVI